MPRAQRRIEALRRGRNAAVAAAAEAQENNATQVLTGCPVLDPIECQCPRTELGPGEGVKMVCTTEACPFQQRALHIECYQLLEDNLVKRLGTLGSARGWTVPQRRNNLWERKGQSLIGRFCRCRCGHGQMTRDKQALYEKEKAVEKEKKKKAKKAKQLPQLQFNSKPTAVQEEKREGKKRDSDPFSPTSNRTSFSITSRSRLYTDRSTSSIQTIAVFDTQSEVSLVGETSARFHADDSDMDALDEEFHTETVVIIPAPTPPPQTKSYAATILNDSDVSSPSPTVGDNKKSAQTPDSGVAQCSPRLSSSDLSSQDDLDQGDFGVGSRGRGEGLNPLGLSILPSLDAMFSELEYKGPPGLEGLTATPQIKKESIYNKIPEIRTHKSTSIPKLPLATPTPVTPLDSNGNRYGINFGAPVREIMDSWLMPSSTGIGNLFFSSTLTNIGPKEDVGWTPFFGRGFNLGERLLYFP